MIQVDAICMEDYVATDSRPLDRCLADVRSADLFLGILAWRYGFIPEGQSLSITELEYWAARASGIPVFIFILRDNVAWPADRVDSDLSRISRFRGELEKEHVVSYFKGPADLAYLVVASVHLALRCIGSDPVTLSPKLADRIYRGAPGEWQHIVDDFSSEMGRDWLRPSERLALVVSYDIARVRKLEDAPGHLVFVDSSWLSQGYGFWQSNSEMARWVRELGSVARSRAKRGLRTSRAFYWAPQKIGSYEDVVQMSNTIFRHLSSGITVFLIETTMWPTVLDLQVFSEVDGLSSSHFQDFTIEQHQGPSEMESLLDRVRDLEAAKKSGDVVFFDASCKVAEILEVLSSHCPLIGLGGETLP